MLNNSQLVVCCSQLDIPLKQPLFFAKVYINMFIDWESCSSETKRLILTKEYTNCLCGTISKSVLRCKYLLICTGTSSYPHKSNCLNLLFFKHLALKRSLLHRESQRRIVQCHWLLMLPPEFETFLQNKNVTGLQEKNQKKKKEKRSSQQY